MILPKSPLGGDSHNYFEIPTLRQAQGRPELSRGKRPRPFDRLRVVDHVCLNIFPTAVWPVSASTATWGSPKKAARAASDEIDVGADETGAGCSAQRHVLRCAAQPDHAGTCRQHGRRLGNDAVAGPGADWAIVGLVGDGPTPARLEIDTNHFKGKLPRKRVPRLPRTRSHACRPWIRGLDRTAPADTVEAARLASSCKELRRIGPIPHVRLNIFPDGGISRLRVHGLVART